MDKWERAYAAGILDGEGCIRLDGRQLKRGWRFQLATTITSTNQEMTEWLQRRWNGFNFTFDRSKYKATYKRQFMWRVTGPNCRLFLTDVLPYSIIKRPEIELVLQYTPIPKSCRGIPNEELNLRLQIIDQLAELKRL